MLAYSKAIEKFLITLARIAKPREPNNARPAGERIKAAPGLGEIAAIIRQNATKIDVEKTAFC